MNSAQKHHPFTVDFNEHIDNNIVLLSQTDLRKDLFGKEIHLFEGMPIMICELDTWEGDPIEYLVARGVVELNSTGIFPHAKWNCRMNSDGIQNSVDIPEEIKK